MTVLLEKALRKVESLPDAQQDFVALQILETLQDEVAWAQRLNTVSPALQGLAREAREEHQRGETRPLGKSLE